MRTDAVYQSVASELVNSAMNVAVDRLQSADNVNESQMRTDEVLGSSGARSEGAAERSQLPLGVRFVLPPVAAAEMADSLPSSSCLSSSGSETSLLSTSSGDRLEDLEVVRDTGSDTDALLNYYKVL